MVKTWKYPSWSVKQVEAESPPSVELSFSDFIALTISEPQVIICDKPNCVLISGSLCGCVHEAQSLCKGKWKAERESHICSPWETEVKLRGSFNSQTCSQRQENACLCEGIDKASCLFTRTQSPRVLKHLHLLGAVSNCAEIRELLRFLLPPSRALDT